MKSQLQFLSEWTASEKHAGSKARHDVEAILEKIYPMFIKVKMIMGSSKLIKIKKFFSVSAIKPVIKLLFSKNESVIMQYPFVANLPYRLSLKKFLKANHPVLFVHDVDAIRYVRNIEQEVALLNQASALVLHNAQMETYLRSKGLTVPAVNLELFDYLLDHVPDNKDKRIHYGNEIVFAGHLRKSKFLSLLEEDSFNLKWNLYGICLTASLAGKQYVEWKGSYGADEIPFKLEGSFGLVWDGYSSEGCQGNYGEYLRYNNPHKLSLYLVSGLPVITWSEAAIANFVREHKVGILVDRLEDIPEKINALSEAEYEIMRKNVEKIQKKIVKGEFTRSALRKIEKLI